MQNLPKLVIFNEQKRTVALKWLDGTVTRSVASQEDIFDKELGFLIASFKHYHKDHTDLRAEIENAFKSTIDTNPFFYAVFLENCGLKYDMANRFLQFVMKRAELNEPIHVNLPWGEKKKEEISQKDSTEEILKRLAGLDKMLIPTAKIAKIEWEPTLLGFGIPHTFFDEVCIGKNLFKEIKEGDFVCFLDHLEDKLIHTPMKFSDLLERIFERAKIKLQDIDESYNIEKFVIASVYCNGVSDWDYLQKALHYNGYKVDVSSVHNFVKTFEYRVLKITKEKK